MGNGYFQRMDSPPLRRDGGAARQLSETPSAVQGAPPEIGQHNEEDPAVGGVWVAADCDAQRSERDLDWEPRCRLQVR